MNNYVRVFLKGEPVRWFDFPLAAGGNFRAFVMQARFEGFIINEFGYVVHEEVKAIILFQTATPTVGLGTMMPAGQA